ncbi:MAG: DUF5107 domain-containing protein [Cyclobacteriaceae bacterium]
MRKIILIFCVGLIAANGFAQRNATVKEYNRMFKTYPYSDPDPIPKFELIYPYYRFDGYTDKPSDKDWKVVELENEYIKVMILPEIGGKIWTAIEKSTNKPFIYFNQVVKFRDIAMRGAWTSGGIEANYGIIGHTPNCSTPVDFWNEEKADGSVSCYVGTLDLLTQTYWTMEINLPKDKAYFTTRSFWHNSTSVEQPYYTWMNAGIKAAGNLQFIYPGNNYIGHNGEYADWTINKSNSKDISFYENNNFGQYKSYHVFGRYTDFFGGYWHDEDFGMGRYASHADKPGKKIWIWGLSQQGMIWEKLLTDTDGQYVEVQSGRLFNQTADPSTFTPFKHRGFAPYATDEWIEYWFPVKGTKGFVEANPYGSLNAVAKDGEMTLAFSPLTNFSDEVIVKSGEEVLYRKQFDFKTLEVFSDIFQVEGDEQSLTVRIGDKLEYVFDNTQLDLSRPVETPEDFDWSTSYGLWLQGKEFIRSRNYSSAESKLKEALSKDPNYLPALADLAMIMNNRGLHQEAFDYAHHGLRIDTYDPQANFQYGLASKYLGKMVDAKDGFDIALQSVEYRSAGATELSKIYLIEGRFNKCRHYALMAIDYNASNVSAHELVAISYRLEGDKNNAIAALDKLQNLNPLNHFQRVERFLLDPTEANKAKVISHIRNEMPWETYLHLGINYFQLGLTNEAIAVLGMAPENPEVYYWLAFLKSKTEVEGWREDLSKANGFSPYLVFPFRAESQEVLAWAVSQSENWKPKYYSALLYRHANQLDEAKKLLGACGTSPDFAPFYAARADLMKDATTENDLKRAADLNPQEWRYGKLLVEHYLKDDRGAEALAVARTYSKRLPENYMISMLLAKSLLLNGFFEEASKILANTKILPYEGATESKLLYREAWLMQALDDLKNKKTKQALAKIEKARAWPENLGAGKPYEADIDDRVEDYIEAMCYLSVKNLEKANQKWTSIISFKSASTFSASDLLSADAYRRLEKEEEGRQLLNRWNQSEPTSALAKWSLTAFQGQVGNDPKIDDSNYRLVKAIYANF